MGGISKTTIARLVYEKIKEKFTDCCFLENIRVLSHLGVKINDFYNLYDGKKIIANFLRNKKVLLVLDDVSDKRQLENLAEKREWFGPGSRLIITTRDEHLLKTLVLEGCTSLTEVHPSLVRHKKLVKLNLKHCKKLKTLPRKMETSSLNDLNLSDCSQFKHLPEFVESMEHLSVLSLKGTAITC
ncbi:hypothetical protein V8G54_009292 [Vigna mungo]|uniref:NB-ARC domain-containing protein n=1 Tax=Vigna mungo TaxID=3915 RepID=A0AAQ3NUV9_VIGMU